jgi:hypothetical protein
MGKQRLEGDFRDLIKNMCDIWYIKLQTLPLAHTCNPADFIVLTKNKRFLVECKQCNSNSYVFDRTTQKEELLRFKQHSIYNESYLLFCFWKGRKDKSIYYIIPIIDYLMFEMNISKKSANIKDFDSFLSGFRVNFYDIINIFNK